MGSSTFPYPPGFLRRLSLLLPFKHKVHQLEGKKIMALKLKSPQKELAVHKICPLWAKGQVAEPVKTQEAAHSLNYGFSIA